MPQENKAAEAASKVTEPGKPIPTRPFGSSKPAWTRLPKTGEREFWSGLTRSTLNFLILPCEANQFRPPVHSVSIKRRGAVRGTRLILLETEPGDPERIGLLDYVREQAEGR